jgi:hypothetical protein
MKPGELVVVWRVLDLRRSPSSIQKALHLSRTRRGSQRRESLIEPFKIRAESDDAEAVSLALERDRELEGG